jgi:hypothetical protein
MSELEIVIDAKYVRAMGYGHIWTATVRRVVGGELADPSVALRTFDDVDGDLYHGRFQARAEQREVTLTLRRVAERPAALAGFVAADGTIWQLATAR